MPADPLVSVITPTWHRHNLLAVRALPSVRRQTYPAIEHVVVIDGPDRELAIELGSVAGVRCLALQEHDPEARWGHLARMTGISAARGELIAYLDDDDEWSSRHLEYLVQGLREDPSAGFAHSRMLAHTAGQAVFRIGDGPLARGRITTSMILHRRELLNVSTWIDEPYAPDWGLVSRWLDAGVGYVSVDAETVDYWPAQLIDPAKQAYVSYQPHAAPASLSARKLGTRQLLPAASWEPGSDH